MNYTLLNEACIPGDIYLSTGKIDTKNDESGLLDAEELAEYKAIQSEDRKDEFLSSRHYLKELAAGAGFNNRDFSIRKDELGKPYGLLEEQHVFLSIAHSDNLILCGLSEKRDIGVDLEPTNREVHERLKDRIFHADEYDSLQSVAPIRVWTIKEALVKLEGGGLRTNLNEVVISRKGEEEFLGRFNNDKTARICSFQYKKHWISIAYYS